MSKESKITSVHPEWLNTLVPPEYEDEELYRIILFFVIHSPCMGQSSNGISLTDRGWKQKPWYSPNYLKAKIDKAIFGSEKHLLKMVNSKPELLSEIGSLDLDDGFHTHRKSQRMLYVKRNEKGNGSEYMSLFYHIRNSLAHGRIAMFPEKGNDIVFVMEDGKQIGKETENKFEVSARMIMRKSSLLRIIDVLNNPPIENDYSEDIISAIKANKCTKKQIMKELGISENIYEKYVESLKLNGLITFENRKWVIAN